MNQGDIITTKDGIAATVDIITDKGIYISGWGKKLNHPDRIFLNTKMFTELLTSKEGKVTSGDIILTREMISSYYSKRLGINKFLIEGLDKIIDEKTWQDMVTKGTIPHGTRLYYINDIGYYRDVECYLQSQGKYLLSDNNESLDDSNVRLLLSGNEILKMLSINGKVITKEEIASDFGTTILNLKIIE